VSDKVSVTAFLKYGDKQRMSRVSHLSIGILACSDTDICVCPKICSFYQLNSYRFLSVKL